MTRLTWSAGARLAAMATVAFGLLAARSAHAQVMCNDASLVNPLDRQRLDRVRAHPEATGGEADG